MAQTKRCTHCGVRRRVGRYDHDSSRPNGLYSICKACKHTPERREQINEIRRQAHAESLDAAESKGLRWTEEEDRIVLDHPIREAAELTGRTYWAVQQRRYRVRHKLHMKGSKKAK